MGIEPTTYSLGRVGSLLNTLRFQRFLATFWHHGSHVELCENKLFRRSIPDGYHELAKPEPAFLYSGRGGLNTSRTRAPSGPVRIVWGTLPSVRQKSPFFTDISSPS